MTEVRRTSVIPYADCVNLQSIKWDTKIFSGLCKVKQLAKARLYSSLLIPSSRSLYQLLITKVGSVEAFQGLFAGLKGEEPEC